jgi:hypothetical protein
VDQDIDKLGSLLRKNYGMAYPDMTAMALKYINVNCDEKTVELIVVVSI